MTSVECEDIDIYDDLPNVPCVEDNIKELEETIKIFGDEVTRLKKELQEVTTERNELRFKNKNLCINISTLYKTATAEIERKDKLIAQLQREKDNIIFRRQHKSLGNNTKHTSDYSGDHQCSPDVPEQNHHTAPEDNQTKFHHPGPEMEQTELPPATETEETELHHPATGMEQTEFHQRVPDTEQRVFHHPAPGTERTQFHHPENCASNKLTSHMYVPPEKVHTVYSRRRLHMIRENKLIGLDKSSEGFKHMTAIPRKLIPITFSEQHKDINVKVHNSSTYLSKEYVLPSQNETKSKISNSQNCRYLPSARNVVLAETESERIHKTRKEINVHRSKSPPQIMSREPASRHFHQRYEHKPDWKYKAERQYEINRNIFPEYYSHQKSLKSHKIPRITPETSLSGAFRSSSSRAKIVELNTGMKPSEARKTDLVKNTNNKLFDEHNQSRGMKRPFKTKEADEVYLPDSKRQMLNYVTGREWYN